MSETLFRLSDAQTDRLRPHLPEKVCSIPRYRDFYRARNAPKCMFGRLGDVCRQATRHNR